MLTADRLREVLDYDPATGVFTWREKSAPDSRIRPGTVAGYVQHGYRLINVDNRQYRAHRMAWLYVHGEWPTDDIDHINGVRDDNRIANLREATRSENLQNQRRARRDNRSGFLGVSANGKRWKAEIIEGVRRQHLGTFDTPGEAHEAYLAAKRRLHPFFVEVGHARQEA